jgi:hypothetical protein
MKKVILALLSAVLVGLLTAVIWAYVPSLVATQMGADDEVLLVFFLVGPPVGALVGGFVGLLLRVIRPNRRLWLRYLVFFGSALAIGVLLGVIWSDYRCAACF